MATRSTRPSPSRSPFSRMIRTTPSAARLSANGSPDPPGLSPIRKNDTSWSSLSASATATATGARGTASPGPFGP